MKFWCEPPEMATTPKQVGANFVCSPCIITVNHFY